MGVSEMNVVNRENVLDSKERKLAAIRQAEQEEHLRLHEETKVLILRFYMNQRNRALIERTINLDHYDPELWYGLFRQIFGRYPRSNDVTLNLIAACTRLFGFKTIMHGLEDELWQALVDERGRSAFKAQAWAIGEYRRLLGGPLMENQPDSLFAQSTAEAA